MLCREAGQDIRKLNNASREQGPRAVASPMRVRTANGLRSPSSALSPKTSLSKKDIVQLAEQRALEWAAGQHDPASASPRSRSGLTSPSRRTPKTPLLSARGGLLGTGTASPKTAELSPKT